MAKRRRQKPVVQALPRRPKCPWCGGPVLTFEWKARGILTHECEEHGEMADISDSREIKTSLGRGLVIKRIEQFDEQPDVLACGLPVFLEAELARIAGETPEERRKGWDERVAFLARERAERKANPGRTIYSPWPKEAA